MKCLNCGAPISPRMPTPEERDVHRFTSVELRYVDPCEYCGSASFTAAKVYPATPTPRPFPPTKVRQ